MRTIKWSSAYKWDYKRVKATSSYKDIDLLLSNVLIFLLKDIDLPDNYRDHALIGNWVGYRECHIKPDLLLIYRKVDDDILRLARLGSHSELF